MNDQQKFYADISRAMKHARSQGQNAAGIAAAAADFFVSCNPESENAARELARYWLEKKAGSVSGGDEPSSESIDWLADVSSLLSGELEKDRDFLPEDWAEIRNTVNSEAEDMPLEVLSSIMSIFLERRVLD